MNYFENFGMECHLLKIGYSKSNFVKHRLYKCNLLLILFVFLINYKRVSLKAPFVSL
jgi:hypothetical protein